jgi:tetratricopeptide (TPR) repeat protein
MQRKRYWSVFTREINMIKIVVFVTIFLSTITNVSGQYRRDINKELDRLDTDVALVLQRTFDFMPIWSDSSNAVYVSILDQWYTYNITRASLVETTISGKLAGYNQNEILEPIEAATVANFDLDGQLAFLHSTEQDNVKVSIEQKELNSILTIEIDGEEYFKQQSQDEAYVFPSISPDGKYLLFIGEKNGLILVRLPQKKSRRTKLDKMLNKGIRAMNKNDCDKSMKYFKSALEIDSTDNTALHNLALCQFNLNLLDELAVTANAGLRHDPDNFETKELLASLLYLRGSHEKAAALCEEIVDEHPYYYENYYLLLAIYEGLEELKSICNTLEKAQASGLEDTELKLYYLSSCK